MERLRPSRSASRGCDLLLVALVGLRLCGVAQAEEVAPFNSEAMRMLEEVRVLAENGAHFDAAALYSEAARIEPRIVTCMLPVGEASRTVLMRLHDMDAHPEAYAEGPVPRTLEEIQAAIAEDWRDPQALRERGLLFAVVGDWQQAQNDVELALRSDPEPWHVKVLLARIWLGWGDIYSRSLLASVIADEPSRGVPEWWREALSARPPELIETAIAEGARGPVVEATLGEVLLNRYYAEDDPALAAEAAAAFERALQALPAGPPRDRLALYLQAHVRMNLSSALFGAGDLDGFMDPVLLHSTDTSAVDGLCGER